MSNKFNFAWQLVRVQARKIKEVPEKIAFVMDYLKKNPNSHNYDRVRNWLRMTKLGYGGSKASVALFDKALGLLEKEAGLYSNPVDNEFDLKDAETEDLRVVLDDLSKRKYDFQYESVPKAHTEFVAQLEKELSRR